MRDIVVTAIVFGMLPFILSRPYVGVLLWSWLGYMNPHRLAYGFAYDFPFAQIVAITTLVALLFNKEPKRIPINLLTVMWCMFLLWMCLTTAFAIFPDISLAQLIKVAKIQLVTIITMMVVVNRERLNLLIWVIFISIGFYGVKGGLFTIASSGNYLVWGPAGSFISGNNELAFALLMVIPLAYYLRDTNKNVWVRRGLLLSMLLMGVSAIGSHSRGALLAGIAMMAWLWLKSRHKLMTGVFLLMAGLAVFTFMPSKWHDRMDSIQNYEQDGSAMGRINAWSAAINLSKDHLFGGGFDGINVRAIFAMYAPAPDDYHDSHSIYFEVLGDHGIPGLLLFLLIGIVAFRHCNILVHQTKDIIELEWLNTLGRMVQVSLVAYAAGGAFLGLAYFDLYYHLLAIIVVGRTMVDGHVKSANNNIVKNGCQSKASIS